MTALTAIRQPKTATAPEAAHELNGVLNVLTCGSVDDGKSTLIGRLFGTPPTSTTISAKR